MHRLGDGPRTIPAKILPRHYGCRKCFGTQGSSAHKDLCSCFCCKADQYNLPQEPHVVKHVARTFFAALISQHSDDMWAIEAQWSTKSWWECVCDLMDWCGRRYDKAQSFPPTPTLRLSGVVFTLNVERAVRCASVARLERLNAEVRWYLDTTPCQQVKPAR